MLWLGLGYLGLWGALGGAGLGLAFVLFTALDLAYVFWQDRRVFPHSIAGYERYRARVPFLLPSARSLRPACGGHARRLMGAGPRPQNENGPRGVGDGKEEAADDL